MPRDPESLKITKWADSGDRTNPENLSTPIDRSVGYTATAYGGRLVREEVNQGRRELSGAALDSIRYGIPPYSQLVDYLADESVVSRLIEGRVLLFGAAVNNGPGSTVVDPATDGQTAWIQITGAAATPVLIGIGADRQITAYWTPSDVPGLVRYELQWRSGGQSFSTSRQTNVAAGTERAVITGLTNGTQVEMRVRAFSTAGQDWSTIARATPRETFYRFTASNPSFSWPSDATSARVIIVGGGGGNQSGSTMGTVIGGDSSVTVGSVTQTASGGRAANVGSDVGTGGWGEARSVTFASLTMGSQFEIVVGAAATHNGRSPGTDGFVEIHPLD